MKKNSLLILFFIFTITAINAQIILIPKAGISYSNIGFSDDFKASNGQNSRYNLGTMFGVAVNIPVAGPFSIQPELQFAQKGFKYVVESYDSSPSLLKEQSKFKLNYIELPVLGSLQFGDADVQVIINLGPYVGFGIGGKAKFISEDSKNPDDTDVNFTEEYDIKFGKPDSAELASGDLFVDNAFDFGFQAGLGLGVSAGPGYIVLEQRFVYGLLNLNDKPEGVDADVKSQNRSFYVSLGYTIPLGSGGGEKQKKSKNKFKQKGFRF